jgi:hypothetical protein
MRRHEMKYEIYQEKPQRKDMVRLRLVIDDGDIVLMVVDEKGNCRRGGGILRIFRDGSIHKVSGVLDEFGFRLDSNKRVIID